MELQRMLRGDPARNSTLYLAIGVLSLVKAIAVRKDANRFRRELIDAGLFIGVGLALRRYSQVKREKRAELVERVPEWVVSGEPESAGFRRRLSEQFSSEPEPEPTVRERARELIQGTSQ